MIHIKEDGSICILEIEKHPIPSGDAKSEHITKFFYLFDVEPRIVPTRQEAGFLYCVEMLYLFGKPPENSFKIVSADDLHREAGGYCLSAFRYERLILVACA